LPVQPEIADPVGRAGLAVVRLGGRARQERDLVALPRRLKPTAKHNLLSILLSAIFCRRF
jgi:hypothetical protein